jgi:hypothetical protein
MIIAKQNRNGVVINRHYNNSRIKLKLNSVSETKGSSLGGVELINVIMFVVYLSSSVKNGSSQGWAQVELGGHVPPPLDFEK